MHGRVGYVGCGGGVDRPLLQCLTNCSCKSWSRRENPRLVVLLVLLPPMPVPLLWHFGIDDPVHVMA